MKSITNFSITITITFPFKISITITITITLKNVINYVIDQLPCNWAQPWPGRNQSAPKLIFGDFFFYIFFSCPVERQYIGEYLSKISHSDMPDMSVNLFHKTAKSWVFTDLVQKWLISYIFKYNMNLSSYWCEIPPSYSWYAILLHECVKIW